MDLKKQLKKVFFDPIPKSRKISNTTKSSEEKLFCLGGMIWLAEMILTGENACSMGG